MDWKDIPAEEKVEILDRNHKMVCKELKRVEGLLVRALGTVKCPGCGSATVFHPDGTVGDPARVIVFTCRACLVGFGDFPNVIVAGSGTWEGDSDRFDLRPRRG